MLKLDKDKQFKLFQILILACICLALLSLGCATPNSILYGRQISKFCPKEKSCLQQAMLYADFINGEVWSNGTHAFVVKDNKIYDSTNMAYTGMNISHYQVEEIYGRVETWTQR